MRSPSRDIEPESRGHVNSDKIAARVCIRPSLHQLAGVSLTQSFQNRRYLLAEAVLETFDLLLAMVVSTHEFLPYRRIRRPSTSAKFYRSMLMLVRKWYVIIVHFVLKIFTSILACNRTGRAWEYFGVSLSFSFQGSRATLFW